MELKGTSVAHCVLSISARVNRCYLKLREIEEYTLYTRSNSGSSFNNINQETSSFFLFLPILSLYTGILILLQCSARESEAN